MKFQTEITDAGHRDQAESVIQKFSSEFTLITSEKESSGTGSHQRPGLMDTLIFLISGTRGEGQAE